MVLSKDLFKNMFVSLEKSVAVYELLHAHARGQTDLTEEQLASVVTGVTMETRDVLRAALREGGDLPLDRLSGWLSVAHDRATVGYPSHGHWLS